MKCSAWRQRRQMQGGGREDGRRRLRRQRKGRCWRTSWRAPICLPRLLGGLQGTGKPGVQRGVPGQGGAAGLVGLHSPERWAELPAPPQPARRPKSGLLPWRPLQTPELGAGLCLCSQARPVCTSRVLSDSGPLDKLIETLRCGQRGKGGLTGMRLLAGSRSCTAWLRVCSIQAPGKASCIQLKRCERTGRAARRSGPGYSAVRRPPPPPAQHPASLVPLDAGLYTDWPPRL